MATTIALAPKKFDATLRAHDATLASGVENRKPTANRMTIRPLLNSKDDSDLPQCRGELRWRVPNARSLTTISANKST
jgi:hypothetical protein